MKEIQDEEADYVNYPLPKFNPFKSKEERERRLYKNFLEVNQDILDMIKEIQEFKVK